MPHADIHAGSLWTQLASLVVTEPHVLGVLDNSNFEERIQHLLGTVGVAVPRRCLVVLPHTCGAPSPPSPSIYPGSYPWMDQDTCLPRPISPSLPFCTRWSAKTRQTAMSCSASVAAPLAAFTPSLSTRQSLNLHQQQPRPRREHWLFPLEVPSWHQLTSRSTCTCPSCPKAG